MSENEDTSRNKLEEAQRRFEQTQYMQAAIKAGAKPKPLPERPNVPTTNSTPTPKTPKSD
ncbi:hypothetical protein IPM62_02390 [Candidatus Woesebacteria bacterium]|nr:MAG: hypothetical protein IPM62_02390 [Candidatus Woesebacteria bacterium]